MATHKHRIDLLELEMGFRRWLWHERLLKSLSVEQLEEYTFLGRLPEPLPKCLPRGKRALDGLDRKRLRQLGRGLAPLRRPRKGRIDFLLFSRALAGAGMYRAALQQSQVRRDCEPIPNTKSFED